MKPTILRAALAALLSAAALTAASADLGAQTVSTDRIVGVRGLALAGREPESLHLATRHGLLRATPDGMSALMPGLEAGVSTLAVHPADPKVMLASGYAPNDDKLGVMRSEDGGESWSRISDGAKGGAAFADLDFAPSDPEVVYGLYEGVQVSRDGGRTWAAAEAPPEEALALAVSPLDADTVYAATTGGISVSRDGGRSWSPAYSLRRPATMVHAAPDGRLHAFVVGVGLIETTEPALAWKTLAKDFDDRVLFHMESDPDDPGRFYASADTGAIVVSGDGGRSWTSYEGSHVASAETIEKGRALFEENCQACHGAGGIGESPEDPFAEDEFGFKAPALNDDAHAWHHSDAGLAAMVLNGSPRNERMVAFKESLSEDEVTSLIAYIKSLWNFRSIACQGARHMGCMQQQAQQQPQQ